ncbi:helix-turn-helix domain-containing protein [Amphibiibacter pelophylacis]|uniref:Helix-turn-helix transcriptional regulator n=1 Tax=Amphibiibacter pelophylacis TaxID=1799477 RepID=A0ACC6P2Q6_9BURK
MSDTEQFAPVDFEPEAYARQRSAADPAFKSAHDALEDEFSALDVLLRARKEAGLSQAEVAQRMGIAPASLARIESSVGNRRHAPSLSTLRRYAQACGKRLALRLD